MQHNDYLSTKVTGLGFGQSMNPAILYTSYSVTDTSSLSMETTLVGCRLRDSFQHIQFNYIFDPSWDWAGNYILGFKIHFSCHSELE